MGVQLRGRACRNLSSSNGKGRSHFTGPDAYVQNRVYSVFSVSEPCHTALTSDVLCMAVYMQAWLKTSVYDPVLLFLFIQV